MKKSKNYFYYVTLIFILFVTFISRVGITGPVLPPDPPPPSLLVPNDWDIIEGFYDPPPLDLEDVWFNDGDYFSIGCLTETCFCIITDYWASVKFFFDTTYSFSKFKFEFTCSFIEECVTCKVYYTQGDPSIFGPISVGTYTFNIDSSRTVTYVYLRLYNRVIGCHGDQFFNIDFCHLKN